MSAPIVTGDTTVRELEAILLRTGIEITSARVVRDHAFTAALAPMRAEVGSGGTSLASALNAALVKAGAR